MMDVVYWLPTGRLLAQADWLGPLALFLQSPHELLQCSKYNDSTINIVQDSRFYYYHYIRIQNHE